jgi:hypothetical protein
LLLLLLLLLSLSLLLLLLLVPACHGFAATSVFLTIFCFKKTDVEKTDVAKKTDVTLRARHRKRLHFVEKTDVDVRLFENASKKDGRRQKTDVAKKALPKHQKDGRRFAEQNVEKTDVAKRRTSQKTDVKK